MSLQEIFIGNLKKFRKKRGLSQMALAELCDTSGNYISQIEMGRRIPSFDKIEQMAAALRIPSYELFMKESEDPPGEPTTSDYLADLPSDIKKEITARLLSSIHTGIDESFNPKSY
jgi:transcriptional regulator with XRE-family HTH domain